MLTCSNNLFQLTHLPEYGGEEKVTRQIRTRSQEQKPRPAGKTQKDLGTGMEKEFGKPQEFTAGSVVKLRGEGNKQFRVLPTQFMGGEEGDGNHEVCVVEKNKKTFTWQDRLSVDAEEVALVREVC